MWWYYYVVIKWRQLYCLLFLTIVANSHKNNASCALCCRCNFLVKFYIRPYFSIYFNTFRFTSKQKCVIMVTVMQNCILRSGNYFVWCLSVVILHIYFIYSDGGIGGRGNDYVSKMSAKMSVMIFTVAAHSCYFDDKITRTQGLLNPAIAVLFHESSYLEYDFPFAIIDFSIMNTEMYVLSNAPFLLHV